VIKYLSHCSDTLKVNFSKSNAKKELLEHLADELACRHICVEELNLSKLKAVDDELLDSLSGRFFKQQANGTSSSLNSIILDDNNITEIGLYYIIDAAKSNTLLRKISMRNCGINFTADNPFKWSLLMDSLRKNCGITEIDLSGNSEIPEEL